MLVHVTLVRGTHHLIDGQEKLMLAFFESAIAMRIPPNANPAKGPVKLVGGLEKTGWIQDELSKTVYAPDHYPAGKDPRGLVAAQPGICGTMERIFAKRKGDRGGTRHAAPRPIPAGNTP